MVCPGAWLGMGALLVFVFMTQFLPEDEVAQPVSSPHDPTRRISALPPPDREPSRFAAGCLARRRRGFSKERFALAACCGRGPSAVRGAVSRGARSDWRQMPGSTATGARLGAFGKAAVAET